MDSLLVFQFVVSKQHSQMYINPTVIEVLVILLDQQDIISYWMKAEWIWQILDERISYHIRLRVRMWYEIFDSGIFIFMKHGSNNVFILYFGYENLNRDMRYTWSPERGYEIHIVARERILLFLHNQEEIWVHARQQATNQHVRFYSCTG